jgi:hypothetical protein
MKKIDLSLQLMDKIVVCYRYCTEHINTVCG